MKKFKKSIDVNYENIKDALQVPIVEGIYKVGNDAYTEGCGRPYSVSSTVVIGIIGFDHYCAIDDGCVLAVDVCDNWHAFTKEQWEKHKDDEI